jgi:glycosyltransferase involved in cell wall biosynthesis
MTDASSIEEKKIIQTMREPVDVLLVSPGTTAGWRQADAELVRALEGLGASVATCTSDYRIVRHLRRTVLLTDLAEAAAMRHALTRALRRRLPRAIVYSSPQATMLQPRARLEGATAVRFDVPARINRSGPGSRLLHALERRALSSVRLLLPIGLEPREDVRDSLDLRKPQVALPIPVASGEAGDSQRDPIAVAYAGNPEKKGLDIALRAWQVAAPPGWRLVVTGIEQETAQRFLRRRDVAEPEGVEWAGVLDRARYDQLIRRAAVFLAASRYEDYGLAQLEALAAGALLVTVASAGPYEALRAAQTLDSRLVAVDGTPAGLARALAAALALDEQERIAYRERARDVIRPYSREALSERLRTDVLPALLS